MPDGQGQPLLGALTQTLVKSPVIRSIIPARIRHADKYDIILIRNDSIEINEVNKIYNNVGHIRDAFLTHVASKADFDSNIRAAKVFGKPRIYGGPMIPGKVDQAQEGLPAIIKEEDNTVPRSFYLPGIPPHILAITLESSKIVFLCTFYDFSGHVRWLSNCRVLPDYAQTYSKQLGEHIAVDPKSRAMAVAANEGSFVLYSLKSMGAYSRPLLTRLIAFHALQVGLYKVAPLSMPHSPTLSGSGNTDHAIDRQDETGS